MLKRYKIVIDTLGSDKGPLEIVKGAKEVLNNYPNVDIVLVGDKNVIESSGIDLSRITIVHAPETVTNYDNPIEAFYIKADVSIFKAIEYAANNETIGMITAGNSGALLVGTIRYLLEDKSVRPCMAAILPNMEGKFTCLVDTGATIDCLPTQLVQFAHLGSKFMKYLYKIDSPKVGLLSNGMEPTKGNKLVKETHLLLKDDPNINFIGNIEGNKTLSGLCDVLVCDGFAGNQVLKNCEGMATNLVTEIIRYGKKTGLMEQTMAIVTHIMKTYDFESLGAGIVLGAKIPVMKCRGSSGEKAIASASHYLINIAENKSLYDGTDERN